MKKLTITTKLGDLKPYGAVADEVEASFSLDYTDDSSIADILEKLPGMVSILVNSVIDEKAKQENPSIIVEKKAEEE